MSSRQGVLVVISPRAFSNIIKDIKDFLSKSNATLNVKVLITRVNSMLRGYMNYFGLSRSTRYQLRYLDDLINKRFERLLIQKHKSKPKRGTFISSTYRNSGQISVGSLKLLRTRDIHPFSNIPMHFIAPALKHLKSNIYLDELSQNEHEFKIQKLKVLWVMHRCQMTSEAKLPADCHGY